MNAAAFQLVGKLVPSRCKLGILVVAYQQVHLEALPLEKGLEPFLLVSGYMVLDVCHQYRLVGEVQRRHGVLVAAQDSR